MIGKQIRTLRLVRKYLAKTQAPPEWRWRADYLPMVVFKKSSERRPWSAAEDFFILSRATASLRALPPKHHALDAALQEGGDQGTPARTDQHPSGVPEHVAPGAPELAGKGNHSETLPDWSLPSSIMRWNSCSSVTLPSSNRR